MFVSEELVGILVVAYVFRLSIFKALGLSVNSRLQIISINRFWRVWKALLTMFSM